MNEIYHQPTILNLDNLKETVSSYYGDIDR